MCRKGPEGLCLGLSYHPSPNLGLFISINLRTDFPIFPIICIAPLLIKIFFEFGVSIVGNCVFDVVIGCVVHSILVRAAGPSVRWFLSSLSLSHRCCSASCSFSSFFLFIPSSAILWNTAFLFLSRLMAMLDMWVTRIYVVIARMCETVCLTTS